MSLLTIIDPSRGEGDVPSIFIIFITVFSYFHLVSQIFIIIFAYFHPRFISFSGFLSPPHYRSFSYRMYRTYRRIEFISSYYIID